MIVDVFIPCEIDQFYPTIGINMIKRLEQLECSVCFHPEQVCCGRMAFEWGNWKETKKTGEKFLAIFSGNHPIVCPSLSCPTFIRNHYKKIFQNTASHVVYQQLSSNIFEFCDFVYHKLNVTDFRATFPHKVTWIDFGGSSNYYQLSDAPQKLLSKVKGLEVVNLRQNTSCYNLAGGFSCFHESITNNIIQHIVSQALENKSEYISSTDMSCLMPVEQYIQKEKLDIRVIHIIDILSSKS